MFILHGHMDETFSSWHAVSEGPNSTFSAQSQFRFSKRSIRSKRSTTQNVNECGGSDKPCKPFWIPSFQFQVRDLIIPFLKLLTWERSGPLTCGSAMLEVEVLRRCAIPPLQIPLAWDRSIMGGLQVCIQHALFWNLVLWQPLCSSMHLLCGKSLTRFDP